YKTPTALRLHVTYCELAPENGQAIEHAASEARLFSSLFPRADVPAVVADDSSSDDEADVALGAPSEVEREADDAMDLDEPMQGPAPRPQVVQCKSYSIKIKMKIIGRYDTMRAALLERDPDVAQVRVAKIVQHTLGSSRTP